MRVLVLIPHRRYPTHGIVDEWLSIYPAATVGMDGTRIFLTGPRGEELLRVDISVLNTDKLRGTHYDEIDVRLIIPADLSPGARHFLDMLEAMATTRKAAAGHDMMPLVVAHHLGLIAGEACGVPQCDRLAIAARFDAATTLWLPTCYIHQFAPLVSPSGDPVRTPAPGTSAPDPVA